MEELFACLLEPFAEAIAEVFLNFIGQGVLSMVQAAFDAIRRVWPH